MHPHIPMTAEDWKTVYEIARNLPSQAPSVEQAVLNAIFGDEYLKQTIDLLSSQLAVNNWDIFEPIEKFLCIVSSPAVRRYLIEMCFKPDDPGAVQTACLLLPSLAHPDMWERLRSFAQSTNRDIQRCGAAICSRIVLMHLMSGPQIEQAVKLFEGIEDEYIAGKVKGLLRTAASP